MPEPEPEPSGLFAITGSATAINGDYDDSGETTDHGFAIYTTGTVYAVPYGYNDIYEAPIRSVEFHSSLAGAKGGFDGISYRADGGTPGSTGDVIDPNNGDAIVGQITIHSV